MRVGVPSERRPTMTGHIPPDDLPEVMVRYFCSAARTDIGMLGSDRMVPPGSLFADALRCRVAAWCTDTDDADWLIDAVWRLANITADLVEGAGRG